MIHRTTVKNVFKRENGKLCHGNWGYIKSRAPPEISLTIHFS